jgi:hypothetical protein
MDMKLGNGYRVQGTGYGVWGKKKQILFGLFPQETAQAVSPRTPYPKKKISFFSRNIWW